MNKKIIIVGGVAGGATAAARLRRLDETAEIILFERGEYVSFANCGLPYYIGETIKQRDKLLVQTVEGISKRYQLDVRVLNEVVKIDRENKIIHVNNLNSGEIYQESYDDLILSPGAKPIFPRITGIEQAQNLFILRNIPDTDKIKQYVDQKEPQKAVIVGGGFIGIEMAENLVERGLEVTLIEMANQVMAPIDYEMATFVHQKLKEKGINLILSDGVKEFSNEGKEIILSSGLKIDTDMTILSIGVQPENRLAADAGLPLGARGGILVNEYLKTEDDHIYAIGDAIEVKDYLFKSPAMIPLAGPANRQGRIVADNIYDRKTKYKGTLGTSIVRVFDLTVAATGLNEKILKQQNKAYKVIHTHPFNHATYYPGAKQMALKIIFNPENGQILGAQAVGGDGVDKRIDVLASAIQGELSVFELQDLELAYAPPFSSAKDPVNMLGFIASNIIEDGIDTIQWHEIDQTVDAGGCLVDVRNSDEYERGAIPGAINIPLDELRERLNELPSDEPIYITCQVGLRGYLATRILKANSYQAINLDGGYRTYNMVKNQ